MHALDIDNEIAVQFAYFVTEIKAFGAMDRTDSNRVAQNVLVPIFKEIYGYSQLRNLDVGTGGNFPSLDLADDIARVAIQVTSTPTLEKVKHTLQQFLQDRPEFDPPLVNRYDRVIVYLLTEKQKSYSQPSIDLVLAGRFLFSASRDIWDYTNLIADIQSLSLAKKEVVLGILKSQLGFTLSQLATTGLVKVPEGIRTEYFVGRDVLLEQVHTTLTGDGVGRRIVVLTGMGGLGKTQAALEYVLRHRGSYTRVLWSSAESEASFLDSLKSLTQALLPATRRMENPSDILAALARWMNETRNANWLLVVDGANFQKGWTQGRFRALLPATTHGKLLITSQYQEFSAFPDARVFPVDVLSSETAVTLLLRFAQRFKATEAERDAAGELARMLGGLPIALEQAAAYVRTTGLSFAEYKSLLHKYGLPVLPADFDHATDYRHSVQTVCRVAFEAVKDRSPTARRLLEFIAFLSAESNCLQPLTMLAITPDGPLSNTQGSVADPTRITSELLRLVGTLHNYSLLTADHQKATIRIHRIVQMAARDELTADKRRGCLESWSSVFGFFLKGEANSANWDFIESWFPHVRAVAETVISDGVDGAATATFLEGLARYLGKRAHYQEAKNIAARAVMIRKSATSEASSANSRSYADSLICLAVTYYQCNESDKAITALDEAIDILRSNQLEELSSLATALVNLATAYMARGDLDEAEPLFEQVLNDPKLRSAPNCTVVFGALTGLAVIASKRKNYEKAVALTGEAVAELASEADPEIFNLANGYNNLGVMLAKQGRFEEAQEKYERALELFQTILPKTAPAYCESGKQSWLLVLPTRSVWESTAIDPRFDYEAYGGDGCRQSYHPASDAQLSLVRRRTQEEKYRYRFSKRNRDRGI